MSDSFKNGPVFVVGSSRSGTTLMYSILLSSGEFAIYQAETMLLSVCKPKYGDLSNDKNYEKFINDWIRSKQFYRSGLDPVKFQQDAVSHRSSYTEFMRFFMETTARNQGKKRWAEQTPGHVFHLDTLADKFPDAKFVHMIRDGRDVAISRRKLGWTSTSSKGAVRQLVHAALDWEECVKAGLKHSKQLGDRYIEIKYEELIENLDSTLKRLNHFLQLNITQDDLQNSTIGSLGKANTTIDGEMKGVSTKALKRWKTVLNEREIAVLNICIGSTLDQLGYELDGSLSNSVSTLLYRLVKYYSSISRLNLKIKRYLKYHTMLGRYSSENIEIGKH